MKSILIYLSALLFILKSTNLCAQVLSSDPVLTSAIVGSSVIETALLSDMKSNQKKIIAAQVATTALIAKINDLQQKTVDGLTYVSTVVKNGYQLVRCYKVLQNIYNYQSKMLKEAQREPLALIFAYKSEELMVTKAIGVYSQIRTMILKEDANYLLDSGDRTRLMFTILNDLEAIEGFSAMAYYEVHSAVVQGVLRKLNPFNQHINNDARLVKDVLNSWKF